MEKHTINYNGRVIPFVLQRKKVKNLNLKVRPDTTVAVSANHKVPYSYVEQFVQQKAPWIIKKIDYFKEKNFLNAGKQYASGEIVFYLGKPYSLRVYPAKVQETVGWCREDIKIYVNDPEDYFRKEKLFYDWLKEEAKPVFLDSLDRMHAMVKAYGIGKPSVTVRTMKTRWGSCSWHKQKITLNTELLKKPRESIDYVVLHELAHFLHKKHDHNFYNFLTSVMPDWRKRKKLLEVK
ncbi:MAG: SprT family zinc-dependent metalloprotease [Bacillota bacterium]